MPLVKVKRVGDVSASYRMLFYWCEACDSCHAVRIDDGPKVPHPKWTWNGDREKPTLNPSILEYTTDDRGQRETLCHHFLRSGVIEYCGDNPHRLNGQRVPLIPIPETWGISGDDA